MSREDFHFGSLSSPLPHPPSSLRTPLEKQTQVWFELQEEISFAHEILMKMLPPENVQIKKIYSGTYTTDV